MSNNTYILTGSTSFLSNFKAVTKMGLSLSVVFSSIAGYLLAAESIHLFTLFLLAIGGYFMVGASNVFNQIIDFIDNEITRFFKENLFNSPSKNIFA